MLVQKPDCVLVLADDERGDAPAAQRAQARLPRRRERGRDAVAPVVGDDREPVHVAAPPVPRRDERADDGSVDLRDEERAGIEREQRGDRCFVVGRARAPRPRRATP